MPEPQRPTPRPASARGGAKHVYLSEEGRAAVQAWADREGVTFSAAIETLARLGLQEDPRDAWSPALTAKIIAAVRADLGRYRALLAATALDAGIGMRYAAAAAKALRPKDYSRMKQLARVEAVQTLRTRDALAELGLRAPTEASAPTVTPASETARGAGADAGEAA